MFTGLITDIGMIVRLERRGDLRCAIRTAYATAEIGVGDSIACSGICLTVVDKSADSFAVDISAATLACTTAGNWREGTRLNLERALRVGDAVGGHFVAGHVDGVGTLREKDAVGDSLRLVFGAPSELLPFIARKGSVAVDGVSLTVNGVDAHGFTVNIIPHTQAVTTLGALDPGEGVNLEVDIMARYAARWMETR